MWTKENIPYQTGKTVIVTGANAGIGYETALALYEKGAKVILACRDLNKANAAAKAIQVVESEGSVEVLHLDLADLTSVKKAAEIAGTLKNEHKCDLIICLSHLGYKYSDNTVSDQTLAVNNDYIDLIIGGHTHTFMPQPQDVKNRAGNITTINQVGYAGINLGRVDYFFESYKGKQLITTSPYMISDQLDN